MVNVPARQLRVEPLRLTSQLERIRLRLYARALGIETAYDQWNQRRNSTGSLRSPGPSRDAIGTNDRSPRRQSQS